MGVINQFELVLWTAVVEKRTRVLKTSLFAADKSPELTRMECSRERQQHRTRWVVNGQANHLRIRISLDSEPIQTLWKFAVFAFETAPTMYCTREAEESPVERIIHPPFVVPTKMFLFIRQL